MPRKPKKEIIKGQRFGRLVALKLDIPRLFHEKNGRIRDYHNWLCRCDCGNIVSVQHRSLTSGNTRSCGCLRIDHSVKVAAKASARARVTHGDTTSKEYKIWASMLQRCLNPNCCSYPNYGGRGIKVIKQWYKYKLFLDYLLKTIGRCPDGMSIDRIDNDKNYCPGNLRWATRKQQQNNQQRHRRPI